VGMWDVELDTPARQHTHTEHRHTFNRCYWSESGAEEKKRKRERYRDIDRPT